MIHSIKFSLTDHGYYRRETFSSDEMILLSMFLTTDFDVYGYDFLMDWAKDPEQDGTNANITYLEKKDNIVSLGNLLDKEPRETFDLPLDQFIKLLNEWERVTKQKPKEIVITWDGKEIDVEGKH